MPVPKVHFIGVAGSGVSALAQFHAMGGGAATGSDRIFDRGEAPELSDKLSALGVVLFPQDGSALDSGPAHAVASAAVEGGNPDLERARTLGLKVLHRADALAEHVARHRTIAVAGTSGKSTVAAMIFEILDAEGTGPSIITGGALRTLERRGLVGNAFRGGSDLLVVEADESDGTLNRYRPWLGVLLNVSKDHKEVPELLELFAAFRGRCAEFAVHAGAPGLEAFAPGALTFGLGPAELRAEALELGPEGSVFRVSGVPFALPAPGRHNVENALAAVAACLKAGVSLEASARALQGFQGVARRMQVVGAARGVTVVDDFAHNPAKIEAALAAAHLRARRVHAVFQLHGYGPARFLKAELVEAFARALGSEDTLWMPEIYYVGGTADRSISARDIASSVAARGRAARFFEDRSAILPELARAARPGDLVLVLGARDPSLSRYAKELLSALAGSTG